MGTRAAQRDAGIAVPADTERESVMGAEKKAKNKAKVIKGKTKKHVGRATGNERLKTEGRADQVSGNLKNAGEKVKDAFRH
ncbi:MAG TPA: CsbD family protein [Streptosporangiaceae bacterium]|nr:CsbD family protein [Streptosporangiaceae bacterium]